MDINEYKFGKAYGEKIPASEANKFATLFGEGSPALTNLIEYCILNNIATFASCKGHPEDRNVLDRIVEEGYITFRFDKDYNNDDFAYYLASIPSLNKKIYAHIESNRLADRTITFYVPAKVKGESEKYFNFILDELKKYQQIKENNEKFEANPDIKKIVDYIFYSWNEYESFDITYSSYKKYIRVGTYLKKIASCPSYSKNAKLHEKLGLYLKESKKVDLDDFIKL